MKQFLLAFIFFSSFSLLNAQTWSACGTGTGGHIDALQSYNGKLYVGGRLDSAGNNPVLGIARWDGANWDTWSPFVTGTVQAFESYNGVLYAGGEFQQMDNSWSIAVSQWNNSAWSDCGTGVYFSNSSTNPQVYSLAEYNGEIYAGGSFDMADGNNADYIAKWNGINWTACGAGVGPGGPGSGPQALAVYNGELYAGGYFTLAGGNPANYIARWNGTSWSPCGLGMNGVVAALTVYNGELYAGGAFTLADGNPANYIAKWNGSSWTACGTGLDNGVSALEVYGGKLYVGGTFTLAGSNPANYIASWNGTTWAACGLGMDYSVYALEVFNGQLYAGGGFTFAGGNPANRLARYDTTLLDADNETSLNENISVYPNPSSGQLHVHFAGLKNETVQIRVADLIGQTVLEKKEENAIGEIEFNISELNDGIYFLSVQYQDGKVQTKKIFIRH